MWDLHIIFIVRCVYVSGNSLKLMIYNCKDPTPRYFRLTLQVSMLQNFLTLLWLAVFTIGLPRRVDTNTFTFFCNKCDKILRILQNKAYSYPVKRLYRNYTVQYFTNINTVSSFTQWSAGTFSCRCVVGSGISNVDKCGRLSQPSWLLGTL